MKTSTIYRLRMAHSGQEKEYGNDFNYNETIGVFATKSDAKRVMLAELKSRTGAYCQNEVKIGDDSASLTVRGYGYRGADEFYSFDIIRETLICELDDEIYLPAIHCCF